MLCFDLIFEPNKLSHSCDWLTPLKLTLKCTHLRCEKINLPCIIMSADMSEQELKEEFSKLLDFYISFYDSSKREEMNKALRDGVIQWHNVQIIKKLIERAKHMKILLDFISVENKEHKLVINSFLEKAKGDISSGYFDNIPRMNYDIAFYPLILLEKIKIPDFKGKPSIP